MKAKLGKPAGCVANTKLAGWTIAPDQAQCETWSGTNPSNLGGTSSDVIL